MHPQMSMLKRLMKTELEKYNIIRFHESSEVEGANAPVFELLDIRLHDYMTDRRMAPLPLELIRAVIQQVQHQI